MLQYTSAQNNVQFCQARVRALLIEKDAQCIEPSKEETVTGGQKTADVKLCSVILRGLGIFPLADVIKFVDDPKGMWNALSERSAGI